MSKYTHVFWRWTCAGRQSVSIMAVSDAARRRANRKVNVTRAGNYGNYPPSPSNCWNSCNRLVAWVGWALKGWLLRTSQHHSCSSYINISANWRASTLYLHMIILSSTVTTQEMISAVKVFRILLGNGWVFLQEKGQTRWDCIQCAWGEKMQRFFFLFRHQGSICFFTLSFYYADRALGTWQRR